MPKICYIPRSFSDSRIKLIGKADKIMTNYAAQGYDLTLRQLFYQFVSRGIIDNKQEEYNKLGSLINDARLAGLLDWQNLVDRTRQSQRAKNWERPSAIIRDTIGAYQIDRWQNQLDYLEVWVEKDALVGVIANICEQLDVTYLSCRGYTSQSEMWRAAQRLLAQQGKGKRVHIIHLGDHDPSGIDMSRDIQERLAMFTFGTVDLRRIALNIEQIEQYEPPPNPAKVTDSRYEGYRKEYGEESWELDALEPAVLSQLVRDTVLEYRNDAVYLAAKQSEERGKKTLAAILDNFTDVVKFLRSKKPDDPVLCLGCGATVSHPYCACRGKNLDGAVKIAPVGDK